MIFNVNLMNLSCCYVSINQSVNRHSFSHCITRVCKKNCLERFLDRQVFFVALLSEGGHFCPRGCYIQDLFAVTPTIASHAWLINHYYLGFTNSGREQCLKNSTVSHKALKIVLNTYQTPIKWRDVGSFGFNSMAFCKVYYMYNILSDLK